MFFSTRWTVLEQDLAKFIEEWDVIRGKGRSVESVWMSIDSAKQKHHSQFDTWSWTFYLLQFGLKGSQGTSFNQLDWLIRLMFGSMCQALPLDSAEPQRLAEAESQIREKIWQNCWNLGWLQLLTLNGEVDFEIDFIGSDVTCLRYCSIAYWTINLWP